MSENINPQSATTPTWSTDNSGWTDYDATAEAVLGQDLMLFVQSGPSESTQKPVAFATSCELDISAETIEVSSKMSGRWKEYLPSQYSYQLKSESLVTFKTGRLSFMMLMDLMNKNTPIDFLFKQQKGATEVNKWLKGKAIITALSVKAENNTVCTCSISLQGTGALQYNQGNIGTPEVQPEQ